MHELNFTLNSRINLALAWQRDGRRKEGVWLILGAVDSAIPGEGGDQAEASKNRGPQRR
jgi:hypothetical protein